MKSVKAVMAFARFVMNSALPAQSWKNAFHQAKEKAKQAADKVSPLSSPEGSAPSKPITTPSNAPSGTLSTTSGLPGTAQSTFQFCDTGAKTKNGARTKHVSEVFNGSTNKKSKNEDIGGFREYVKQKFGQQRTFNTMWSLAFASSSIATGVQTELLAQLKSSRMSDPVVEADWTPAVESAMIAGIASALNFSGAGVMPPGHCSAADAYVPIKPLVFNTAVEDSLRATNPRRVIVILKQHLDEIDAVVH